MHVVDEPIVLRIVDSDGVVVNDIGSGFDGDLGATQLPCHIVVEVLETEEAPLKF